MIPVYVNDIKCSLQNNCYFSALALALTLPDICGIAEFPNKSVSERYMEWYDKYLGNYMEQAQSDLGVNTPWLSGEVIYNLRNTYFHQGSPNVIGDKVKKTANQLDRFILVLGDGTQIWDSSINIDLGDGKLTFKAITVDVTWLCNTICDGALRYYENNADKFEFKFDVITQDEFINLSEEAKEVVEGDFLVKLLNQKLETIGSTSRVIESNKPMESIRQGLGKIFSDEKLKQRFLDGDSIRFSKSEGIECLQAVPKQISKEKREAQVRSFFDLYFKEKVYLEKKEEIIQAVLKSETKQQVNNNLMKYFPNKEVSTIYQRLKPLIKELPGRKKGEEYNVTEFSIRITG